MRHATRSVLCSIFTLCVGASATLAQLGQLDPPPGPVSETGPHLGQIQPWRALNDLPGSATAAHVITEPGVYYMTEQINAGIGQSGIEIALDGLPPGEYYVCVVPKGNPIRLSPGSTHGISYTDTVGHDETIEISSGSSDDLRSPISGASGDGVHLIGADRVILRGLEITNCEGDGVHLRDNLVAESENLLLRNLGGDGMDTIAALSTDYVCRKLDSGIAISLTGGSGTRAAECHQLVLKDVLISGANGPGIEIHPSAFIDPGGSATSSSVSMHRCTSSNTSSDGVRIVPQTSGTYSIELSDIETLANTGNGMAIENSVNGANCTVMIDGFDTSGNGANGYLSRHTASGVNTEFVANGTVNGNGGDGIQAEARTTYYKYELTNVMITSTTVNGIRFTPGSGSVQDGVDLRMDDVHVSVSGGHGLHIDWNAAAGPFSVELDNSRFARNSMSGVFLQSADGCGKDNDCNSNGDDGMTLVDSIASFESGAFNKNGGNGVRSEDTSCWIRVSQCHSNVGHGADIQGGAATIDGGLFANNAINGLNIANASAAITSCTVRENSFSGIDMQSSSSGTVAGVNAINNGEYGIWCRGLVSNCSVIDNNCNGNEGGIRVDGLGNVVQRNTATIGVLGGISVAPGSLEGLPVDISNINTHSNPASNVVR